MRMYLGHICTVVLLPCCHPHCLSYLAFMYCRTKYISPVIFSAKEMRRTVLSFRTFLFPWHYSGTEYPFPRHAHVVSALYRAVPCLCGLLYGFMHFVL